MSHYRFFVLMMLLGTLFSSVTAEAAKSSSGIPAVPLKSYRIEDVNVIGGTILGMDIEENLVLLLRSRALEVVDFSRPERPVLLSRMNMPGRTTDMTVRGRAAYIGVRDNGVHMIDFSNPRALRERGFISTETLQIHLGVEGPYLTVWPHYKGDGEVEYLRVDRNPWRPEEAWAEGYRYTERYAVVGTTALQIHSYYDSKKTLLTVKAPDDDQWRTVLSFPYNPERDEGKLITGGKQGIVLANGRLYLLDLGNPLKPVVTGEVTLPAIENTDNVSGCIFAKRFLLLKGYQPTLIEIANPKQPRVIDWKSTQSLEHSWLMGDVLLVRCMASEQPESLKERYWLTAFDCSNPRAPEERKIPLAETSEPIHITTKGKMAYAMMPEGELKVIDCSDPKAIRVRGTLGGMKSPRGSWEERLWEVQGSRLFVVNQEGVQVIDLVNPDHPTPLGTYHAIARVATRIALGRTPEGKTIAWVANHPGRLEAIDMAQPPGTERLGWIDLENEPDDLKIEGVHAYVGSGDTISIADIHNPKTPKLIKTLAIQGKINELALTGNLLLAATSDNGLAIVDVKDPATARQVGTYSPNSQCQGVAARGDLAFLASSGLEVISLADPAHPRRVGWLPRTHTDDDDFEVSQVVLHGKTAYTQQLVDLANPMAPRWVKSFKIGCSVDDRCLADAGQFVYFLNTRSWSGGTDYTLSAYDATDPLQPVKVDEYTRLINTCALAVDEAGNLFIADGIGGVLQLRIVEDTGGSKL